MKLGGPVWHASVGGACAPIVRRRLALHALGNVGNRALEWYEDNPVAYHVRRRLTDAEQRQYRIWVEDLRGTPEARRRRGVAEKNGVPLELLWRMAAQEQAI